MTLDNVTLKVEVAFTAAIYDTAPTWTDISGFVKSVTTKRGRSNEVATIEAGTCTVLLDNADGRFTPHRAASPDPYQGNILPRRPVRVRAVVSETVKPLWTGYTERWSFTHPGGGGYNEATLECVDGLKILGDHKMLDYYGEYIKTTDPTVYYPMFEPSGSIWFNDYSGNNRAVGVLYHRSDNDKSGPGGDALLHNSGSTSVAFDTEGASAGANIDLSPETRKSLLGKPGSFVCWLKLAKPSYSTEQPSPPETTPPPESPATPAPTPAEAPRHVTVNVTREEDTS